MTNIHESVVHCQSYNDNNNVKSVRQLFDSNNNNNNNFKLSGKYDGDILFTFTSLTRYFIKFFYNFIGFLSNAFRNTHYLRFLFKLSQPLHVVTIIAITAVSAFFFPFNNVSPGTNESTTHINHATRFTFLTYLTAFSLHVGSQFWMTFVSGLSLYFNLARHAFGDVQRILFPKYFSLNCMLSGITLIQFSRIHANSSRNCDVYTSLQVVALTVCFLVELIVRIYLVPSVLELITAKTEIEKAAGIGQEVGRYELGPLLKCPHYMIIHKQFRRLHLLTAMGNVLSMMCSAFHMYYLATKCGREL